MIECFPFEIIIENPAVLLLTCQSTGGLTLNFTKNCPKYNVMNVNEAFSNETHLYYKTTFL